MRVAAQFLALLLSVGVFCSEVLQQSRLRWLDPVRDADAIAQVQKAFGDVLVPDEGADRKEIYRIGLAGQNALVLVEMHNRGSLPGFSRFVEAYNYKFLTNERLRIPSKNRMWLLELSGTPRFDHSEIRDVSVLYKDCTECEAITFLSAFRFAAKDGQWTLRHWDQDQDAIAVDTQHFDEDGQAITSTGCAHRVYDFNADGLDDVAVFCREQKRSLDKDRVLSERDFMTVHSMTNDKLVWRRVTDPKEMAKIVLVVCKDNKNEVCRERENPPSRP